MWQRLDLPLLLGADFRGSAAGAARAASVGRGSAAPSDRDDDADSPASWPPSQVDDRENGGGEGAHAEPASVEAVAAVRRAGRVRQRSRGDPRRKRMAPALSRSLRG